MSSGKWVVGIKAEDLRETYRSLLRDVFSPCQSTGTTGSFRTGGRRGRRRTTRVLSSVLCRSARDWQIRAALHRWDFAKDPCWEVVPGIHGMVSCWMNGCDVRYDSSRKAITVLSETPRSYGQQFLLSRCAQAWPCWRRVGAMFVQLPRPLVGQGASREQTMRRRRQVLFVLHW